MMSVYAGLRGYMLGIVLFILKMIGIILAVILGILIVALCLVLFVPLRYRGKLSVTDAEEGAEKKNVRAVFSVTWLLRIVRIFVSYEKTVRLQVKVLFFTLLDTAKEAKHSRKAKKRKADRPKTEAEKSRDKAGPETEPGKSKVMTEPENQPGKAGDGAEPGADGQEDGPERDRQSVKQDASEDIKDDQAQKAEKTSEEKPGFWQRISNIIYTIKNFCDKLKEIKEKGSSIWEFWVSDHMRKSRSILGKQLLYLMKHIKPRKLEGRLAFGFDDPSLTGYAMALYGILYPAWPADVSVEPDFEKQVLLCGLKMKGRIRGCHFARALLILLFSKDVRHVIKDIKSGKVF